MIISINCHAPSRLTPNQLIAHCAPCHSARITPSVGVTRQAISNWERGTATPDVETLNLIAKLFDTDLLAIINGESNEQEKAKDTIPHRTALLIAIIVLMIVHFLLAFLNKIEMIQVVLVPGVLVVLSVLIHFIFRHVTAQNDFSIIAGFDKKKDNVETVKKQLATIDLLNLAVVLFINVLFFAMYTGPKEGYLIGSLIFLSTYFIMIIIIIVGVNLKIKTR